MDVMGYSIVQILGLRAACPFIIIIINFGTMIARGFWADGV
jgi:hypothetical protein